MTFQADSPRVGRPNSPRLPTIADKGPARSFDLHPDGKRIAFLKIPDARHHHITLRSELPR
jgi:hypothetical protein